MDRNPNDFSFKITSKPEVVLHVPKAEDLFTPHKKENFKVYQYNKILANDTAVDFSFKNTD
jgi:hypothetical protein